MIDSINNENNNWYFKWKANIQALVHRFLCEVSDRLLQRDLPTILYIGREMDPDSNNLTNDTITLTHSLQTKSIYSAVALGPSITTNANNNVIYMVKHSLIQKKEKEWSPQMLILYTLHLSCSHVGLAACGTDRSYTKWHGVVAHYMQQQLTSCWISQHRAPQWILYSFCILSVLSDDYNDDNTINSLYARFILFTQYTVRRASRVNSWCVYGSKQLLLLGLLCMCL